MEIQYFGKGEFKVKTKETVIHTNDQTKINSLELSGPGEYEVAGIMVDGIADEIYIFYIEQMTVVHLGKLKRVLTNEEIEKLNGVDVLFLPVEGQGVLTASQAVDLTNQIDPKIVIPMYYDSLDEFLKLEGASPTPVDSFKITKSNLPTEEERKVVVLKCRSKS